MNNNKNPWETPEGKVIWKTKSQYFNWLRGAIRRLWADYPLRKEWKKRQARPVSEEERVAKKFHPSTKKVAECYLCEEWFPVSKLEVDHKTASNGCKSIEEAQEFLLYCGATTGDDWALACIPCHKIKTYADRYGLSFEEARCTKVAIEIEKGDARQWLVRKGLTPASNAKSRRLQIVEFLKDS